jgi:DNA-binding GntR family transcriptional regulator
MNTKKLDMKLGDRDTLHLKVCNVLRTAILQGYFEPGERLIQEDLANSLGVSRMPIREALRKLENEGLINLVPHKGAIVNSFSVEDVEEIYELRANLEKMAVQQSVGKMTEDDIAELERLVIAMKDSEEAEEFVDFNIRFHRALMKHCPWKRLISFIETLWNGFPQQTPHMIPGQLGMSNKEHEEILVAVKEGEPEKASELVSLHISRTGSQLIENIRESSNDHTTLLHKIEE